VADRSVMVRLRADISDFQRKMATAGSSTAMFVKQLDSADSRMGNLVQTALALAPALVPISATAVPALAGLTTQLGFAAAGAGVVVSALNGVGDALGAVNDYQLEPTNANLQKMQEAMAELPQSAREFVRFLDKEIMPALDRLQDVAADGFLPDAQDGLDDLLTRLPQVRRMVDELATGAGTLASEMGEGLASDDFDEFFRFLESEAQPTLVTFGRTVGNIFEGLATTLIGLNPLANDFEDALYGWSRGFADIEPDDFTEFVSYVRDVGPDALDALGSLGSALVSIVQAAAPVGAIALPVIEALADVIKVVAESPAGPVLIGTAAGLSAISRAVALFNAANGTALAGFLGKAGKDGAAAGLGYPHAAAGLGILALSMTDLDDNLGVSNTAMGAMLGLMAGPWGAAVGAGAGALLDLAAAGNDSAGAIADLNRAVSSGDIGTIEDQLVGAREALEEALNPDTVADWATVVVDGFKLMLNGMDESSTEYGKLQDQIQAAEEAAARLNGTRGINPLFAEGLGLTGDALDAATSSADEFRESLARVNRALEGRANLRDYQAALDDFTASVKDNGRTLDIGTEKGRANEAALDNIATTALSVAENFKGMNRVRILDQAREDFIDAAMKLDMGKDAAERLATRLGLLDKQRVNPKIDVDNKPAKNKVDEAEDWILGWGRRNAEARADLDDSGRRKKSNAADDWILAWGRSDAAATVDADASAAFGTFYRVNADLMALDGKRATTYIDTVRTVTGPKGAAVFGSADGSTVPDAPGPYRDQFLYGLAQREEVVSNRVGQADRFRPVLKAINADMPRDAIRGMLAGGGTAGDETDAQKKAREAREEARRRAEERRQREEERRQRQLDKQRTKDLLASNLRDEQEQARLELADARRRLKSAKEAGRPKSEILDARLAFKQERSELGDMRDQRREERLEKAAQMQIDAADIAFQAAQDQVDAAERDLQSAETMRDATQQLRDTFAESVSSKFSGSLTGGGLAGLDKTLSGDIARGSAMDATLKALAAAGLDTTGAAAGLFQELASSEDLTTASQLLAAGPDAIAHYEQQFASRAAINYARADFAADASYSALLVQQTSAVAVAEAAKASAEAHAARLETQVQNLQTTMDQQSVKIGQVINGSIVDGWTWGRNR